MESTPGRPARLVAFYDEVKQEADDVDWPHALRDRLGLGHYGLVGGAPLAVALMRYPLADVFSAPANQQGSAACAMPTVLDNGMHEFFFPVPREHPYGATVHLSLDSADTLTAELALAGSHGPTTGLARPPGRRQGVAA